MRSMAGWTENVVCIILLNPFKKSKMSKTHTFKMLSNNFIILEYDEKNSNHFVKEICFIYCTCEHSKALAIFQAFTVVPIKLY